MRKGFFSLFLYVLMAVLLLPLLITALWGGFSKKPDLKEEPLKEAVIFSELEAYVVGVVAAEMPALFPMEALKAQAVAARTYQVRKMAEVNSKEVQYQVGQAYCSEEERKEKWGENFTAYEEKIREAVGATLGEVMVYEGEPILAAFHAQSSGKTEAAENVWSAPLPYLQSVDSHQDSAAPQNETSLTFSAQEIRNKLSSYGTIKADEEIEIKILSRSQAGYVDKVLIGSSLTLTGRQLREGLGLRSSHFTVEKKGADFVFTTLGYGHGVGMSQYGASFLAEEGMTYHEILQHYYQGISFEIIA